MFHLHTQVNVALLFRGQLVPVIHFEARYVTMENEGKETTSADVLLPVGIQMPGFNISNSGQVESARFQEYAAVLVSERTFSFGPFNQADFTGIFPIFIGIVRTVGYEIHFGRAYIKVRLEHWSSVLRYSSIFGADLVPESALDFGFEANLTLCGLLDPGIPVANKPKAFAELISLINTNFFSKPLELWTSLLYPLYTILSQCRIHAYTSATFAGVADPTLQDPDLLKLNNAFTTDLQLALNSVFGLLRVRITDFLLYYGIFQDIMGSEERYPFYFSEIFGEGSKDSSIATHLKFLALKYFFSIVPTINYLFLIPSNNGIYSIYNPHKLTVGKTFTLDGNDILNIQYAKPTTRSLRGVITLVKSKLQSLSLQQEKTQTNWLGGGFFGLPIGMLIYINAPSYINIAVDAVAGAADPGLADFRDKYDALGKAWLGNRRFGKIVERVNEEVKDPLQAFPNLLERFSQTIYVHMLTGQRVLVVRCGGLRGDIAPGSNIIVGGLEGATPLIGTVSSVEYKISFLSEDKTCSTTYMLGYVRDLTEFNTLTYSIPAHFIFDTGVSGLPML
jgi:hypothetical protein